MSDLSETLGLVEPIAIARKTHNVVRNTNIIAGLRVIQEDRRATVEAVAHWLEEEAMRVEALAVEVDTDKRDWQEANSLRAGARSLRSTLSHLRRELLAAPEEGRDG